MSTINVFQISFEIWGCIIGIIVCILLGTASFETVDVVGKKLWKMILIKPTCALPCVYLHDYTKLIIPCQPIFIRCEQLLLGACKRELRDIVSAVHPRKLKRPALSVKLSHFGVCSAVALGFLD